MIGGAGNDAMNGNAGNDTFTFTANFGTDTIAGFDADATGGQDLLDLRPLGITAATFGTVTRANQGGNTRITVPGANGGVITLSGIAVATVTIADFILAP